MEAALDMVGEQAWFVCADPAVANHAAGLQPGDRFYWDATLDPPPGQWTPPPPPTAPAGSDVLTVTAAGIGQARVGDTIDAFADAADLDRFGDRLEPDGTVGCNAGDQTVSWYGGGVTVYADAEGAVVGATVRSTDQTNRGPVAGPAVDVYGAAWRADRATVEAAVGGLADEPDGVWAVANTGDGPIGVGFDQDGLSMIRIGTFCS